MNASAKHLSELMKVLDPADYIDSGGVKNVLPVGAHVWPVQGKSLLTLWASKGINLTRPVLVDTTTKLPAFMAKKMSYFYGKPGYAMLWLKDPIPLGSSQLTYGMVYLVEQAQNAEAFQLISPEQKVWTH